MEFLFVSFVVVITTEYLCLVLALSIHRVFHPRLTCDCCRILVQLLPFARTLQTRMYIQNCDTFRRRWENADCRPLSSPEFFSVNSEIASVHIFTVFASVGKLENPVTIIGCGDEDSYRIYNLILQPWTSPSRTWEKKSNSWHSIIRSILQITPSNIFILTCW